MEATSVYGKGSNNRYWNMLKNLSSDVKLDLIAKLSASLVASDKKAATSNWALDMAGRWSDSRDTVDIVSDIRSSRTSNREVDLWSAAAVQQDLILVTDNIKHFKNIQGLAIENWVERWLDCVQINTLCKRENSFIRAISWQKIFTEIYGPLLSPRYGYRPRPAT